MRKLLRVLLVCTVVCLGFTPAHAKWFGKDDKVIIGFSLPTQQEERWVRDAAEMEKAAKAEKDVELKVQISNNDAAKQLAQCENLLAQGITVLIVAPQDASSAATIVEKAHKQNVPVIAYDRLIMNCDVDLYTSFDNVKVGELQGSFITKLVPKGNYILLGGAPTDNNARLFRAGAMKYIQPLIDKGDIHVVMDQWVKDWQPTEAMKLVENALTGAHNNVQAILAPNDGTASGCIRALAAQGLAGKVPVTGQDAELAAAQRIVAGTQSMTVFKDTRALARETFKIAVAMANGATPDAVATQVVNNNKIDVPSVLLTPVIVTKDNIDEVLVESGYLKRADVYKYAK
jgi:D-xylose transport system substrate-binding protein